MESTIERIQVIGERCSGTNWIENLLRTNFNIHVASGGLCWKHFPTNLHELTERSDVLFLFTTRNVVDWTLSFYRTPHHVPSIDHRKNLLHFVSHSPWRSCDKHGDELVGDRDQCTKDRYRNVLDMRAKKHRWWKQCSEGLPHAVWIRYEDVLDDTPRFLSGLQRAYNLKRRDSALPWDSLSTVYKQNARETGFDIAVHKSKQCWTNPQLIEEKMPAAVQRYMRDHIDLGVESLLGYEPFTSTVLVPVPKPPPSPRPRSDSQQCSADKRR